MFIEFSIDYGHLGEGVPIPHVGVLLSTGENVHYMLPIDEFYFGRATDVDSEIEIWRR